MNGFDSYRLRERADTAQWILLAAFLILSGAFFRTQVLQHEKFQLKAETNRLRPITIAPPRGAILDWKGEIIAENVPGYSVKLLAPSADSLRAVIARMGQFVGSTRAKSTRSFGASPRRATNRRSYSAMPTSRRLRGSRSIDSFFPASSFKRSQSVCIPPARPSRIWWGMSRR